MLKVLLYLLPVILAIYAVIDCIQTPDGETRAIPKVAWIVIILFFPVIGPVGWLFAGKEPTSRPRSSRPAQTAGYPQRERPRRPVAPDDDPDFLHELDRGNTEHERMLKKWEEDLRRREGEARDGGTSGSGTSGNSGTDRRAGPEDSNEKSPGEQGPEDSGGGPPPR